MGMRSQSASAGIELRQQAPQGHGGFRHAGDLDAMDEWPELNWPGAIMTKLLPPILVVIAVALMLALYVIAPGPRLMPWPFNLAGGLLAATGLTIAAATARRFARIGTNIRTFDEPGTLVSDGLFAYSRNPIYLGFVLFLGGFAVTLGTLSPLLVAVAFALITDRWYIRFEEAAMAAKFGEAYLRYKQTVRRWI